MKNLNKIIKTLHQEYKKFNIPVVKEVSWRKDPYKILISCLLSLRTKDEVTAKASKKLFKKASTPKKMLTLTNKEIEKLIYPVGFYKTKAKRIKEISKILLNKHNGKVTSNIDELLKLKGVGRKTANLTIGLGYGKHSITVDVHVHILANRFGWVKTKNPHETEFALMKILPKKHWLEINDLLVAYGQNVCRTAYPRCGKCVIEKFCIYDKKDLNRV